MVMSGGDSDTVQRKGTPSATQPLEHLNQRQVGAGDGLEEPLLLHHRGVFGVANEGEVRVQDERKVAGGHVVCP